MAYTLSQVIDSRDILESLTDLQNREEDLTPDEREELKELTRIDEEGRDCSPDWEYGVPLIREDYWIEYVIDMIEDCEGLSKKIPTYVIIDWEETANQIKVDYSTMEIGGFTYYIR